ncbi:MAG: hypothetical protein WKG06_33965 [Segetibacter sp.]
MFEEYQILTEKLKTILPFEAFPVRELVAQMRSKLSIRLKTMLLVKDVYNSNDISGIMCIAEMENSEPLACALTHLIIPNSNPLYSEIKDYQNKRIKRIKKLNQF